MYVNSAPVYWMSKKQTSSERSYFGSEFVAMKQCYECIHGIRYKIHIMGIVVNGHAYTFGFKKSILCDTTIPDYKLKKKSQSIAYYFVRDRAARDEWRTEYVNTHENLADILTEFISMSDKKWGFLFTTASNVWVFYRGN